MYDSNVLPTLIKLVQSGSTHFIQVCALGCLGWCTELDSKLPENEFEDLQKCVRNVSAEDCGSLVKGVQHGRLQDKLKSVIYCACIAETHGSSILQQVGVVASIVNLLHSHAENLALWAMNAIGNMADSDDMRCAIAREGVISPLVRFLQTGTNEQQALAAYALGSLASDNDENNTAIVRSGAIPYLVDLLRADTYMQKNFTAFALESLAESDSEVNWVIMANEGAIKPLVHLLRTGTGAQKSHAVSALGLLASNMENCSTIAKEGIVPNLVTMIQCASANQKERAVRVLFFLTSNKENDELMLKGGAIAPLVESLNNGTEEQIEHALCALGNLASHTTENGAAIVNEGAIGSLKAVLRAGTEEHKGLAAFTLGYLGLVNETIRLTVGDEDTMIVWCNYSWLQQANKKTKR